MPKVSSGVQGLDEITGGGLPRGRTTLLCGGAGCGKTLLAVQFLVRGATEHGEPGVFMTFEETADELTQNVRSLGHDLADLARRKLLAIDYVRVEREEIEESGEYDLEGLFIRLGHAIDTIGASRVVLDSLETLFGGLSNEAVLRAELRRLFRWLKDRNVTAVVTGERGDGTLTRHGLEEYVSDCVILLDHRVVQDISTRRMRVVKYRGTAHGTNDYPFLISEDGISVLPVTSLGLQHGASDERVSSGVAQLDEMLSGKGFFRGSTVLVSGMAGSGKTSIAAHFADAACRRGERCLYFSFEESPDQIRRNMRSIGIDLGQWVDKGLLRFHATRSTLYGIESHLATLHRQILDFDPRVAVFDALGNLSQVAADRESKVALTRLIDFLKVHQMTAVMTDLTGADNFGRSRIDISSLVDTWLSLGTVETVGERNRTISIIKSRGMAHSNQLRRFLLTDRGVELADAYLGPDGVLTGSARVSQETREEAARVAQQAERERRRRQRERKREQLEARIAAMRAAFEADEEEAEWLPARDIGRQKAEAEDRAAVARSRQAEAAARSGKRSEKG